jgi:SNF2 family DNA or RNA helicase
MITLELKGGEEQSRMCWKGGLRPPLIPPVSLEGEGGRSSPLIPPVSQGISVSRVVGGGFRGERSSPLYDFQKSVLEWSRGKSVGILGMEMGLGKTLTVMGICIERQYERVLVVMPKSLLNQWRREWLNFTELLSEDILIYQGKGRDRYDLSKYRVILTTYDVVRYDYINLCGVSYDCMIMDEAHKLRNKKTSTYHSCYELGRQIKSKWLLSGTVIHNKYEDVETLCDFLDVSRLEVKHYYYHLTKLSCLELPDKSIHEHYLTFGVRHRDDYVSLLMETKKLYETYMSDPSQVNVHHILTKVLRLRQCCNHPDAPLTEVDYKVDLNRHDDLMSAKYRKVIELIMSAPEEDKMLIFSQWSHSLLVLSRYLEKYGISYELYDGSMSDSNRMGILGSFKRGSVRVMLMTLASGGVGLNLTEANHVILLDSWWNEALENQAIDRVYRIGQRKKVEVHRMYMRGTIEEWMREMKNEKSRVNEYFHDREEIYRVDKAKLMEILHRYL